MTIEANSYTFSGSLLFQLFNYIYSVPLILSKDTEFNPYDKVTGSLSVCTEGYRFPLNRYGSPFQYIASRA